MNRVLGECDVPFIAFTSLLNDKSLLGQNLAPVLACMPIDEAKPCKIAIFLNFFFLNC